MSTSWKCASCFLSNSSQRSWCQACFQSKPKQPPSRLHHKLTPESQQLKQLVIYGYFKECSTTSIIPQDIVRLCTRFYDEATYWIIQAKQLQKCFTFTDKTVSQISAPIFDSFHTDDIKLKFVFEPSLIKENDSTLYIHYFLDDEVTKAVVYSEMFCQQNDAHFKQCLELYAKPRWMTLFNEAGIYESEWQTRQYMVLMHLDCKTLEEILICYHFEILSVEYSLNSNSTAYFKPVSMPKEVEFRWNIGASLMKKLKVASPRQLFLSDSFDEINNNWGLYIFPKDHKHSIYDEEKCQVGLALVLFKRPHDVNNLSVECVVRNSYNNSEKINVVDYASVNSYRFVSPLFPSKELLELDSLIINVKVSIVSITNYHSSLTAMTYKEWQDMRQKKNIHS